QPGNFQKNRACLIPKNAKVAGLPEDDWYQRSYGKKFPEDFRKLPGVKIGNCMPDFSLSMGGAGGGRTTALMEILSKVVAEGYGAEDIGFFSFTRAARAEAAGRAADLLGCKASDLEQSCWFRTLHSLCYRQLGCSKDQVLADDAKTRKWLKQEVGITSATIDVEE